MINETGRSIVAFGDEYKNKAPVGCSATFPKQPTENECCSTDTSTDCAWIHPCYGCFGASMNDCGECTRLETEEEKIKRIERSVNIVECGFEE